MLTCPSCQVENPAHARFCLGCGTRLVLLDTAMAEARKTVTVLFCDLVGSTRLGARMDPEPYRYVLARYHEQARAVLEHYGGTVEKFIGDAVVAVFGIPTLHEDDALRAATAATRLQAEFRQLNEELERDLGVRLSLRIGVNTGDVVVPATGDPTRLLGETVNVADRLQKAARAREILISEATYQLVRDAVIAEPVQIPSPHGGEPTQSAWRLDVVDPEVRNEGRRIRAPLIGREWDLQLLHVAFERAVKERRCHLVTVVGDAGIGKTRLVDASIESISGPAMVLRGTCRAYGEGIGYRPVVQMVRQAAGVEAEHSLDTTVTCLVELVSDRRVAVAVARILEAGGATVEPEDARWALLRFFEALARRRPLILVVDDLHWAHEEMIELLGHLAEWSRDAPILLICIGRPELRREMLERGGRLDAIQLRLQPLGGMQAEELVRKILRQGQVPHELPARIAEAAAGYPLFVEELLGMLLDDETLQFDGEHWVVTSELEELRLPPSLHALLGARLDELPATERLLLGRAAVMRSQFSVSALAALSSVPERDVRTTVHALARKELLQTGTILDDPLPGADRFAFRHTLLRDAAYQSVPKEVRAELHQRYAGWIEQQVQERPAEIAEIVGYHLEAAYRHRIELGYPDETANDLARRAGEWLAIAGHNAVVPGDIPAVAVNYLRRAVELLPERHNRRKDVLLDLADALRGAGDLKGSLRTFEAAATAATGDERRLAHAVLGQVDLLWFSDPRALPDGGRAEVEQAIQVLERANDQLGLAKALRLLAYVQFAAGRSVEARATAERAIGIARAVGDERLQARIARLHLLILFWGPAPTSEVIEAAEESLAWAHRTGARLLEASALNTLARGLAMQRRFQEARQCNQDASGIELEPGELLTWSANVISEGLVELLAGDLDAAERTLRSGYREAHEARGVGMLGGLTVLLARVLLLRGSDAEADAMARECRRDASGSQLDVRLKSYSIRAVVLARRGRTAAATRLAEAVVRATNRSGQPDTRAEVLADLAEVHERAGRSAAAWVAAEEAVAIYDTKGNPSAASRVRAAFAEPAGPV
jgi:class 3 adenylate cyclase/tetratricopeptide (TPR) repeat protein